MKSLTPVQRAAVIVAIVMLVVFAVFIVANLASSGTLPIWAIAGIAAFVITLAVYPLIRRGAPSAPDRKDPK